ncbi:MAG: sugar transferase [Cyclobacteriaceae bacterium]
MINLALQRSHENYRLDFVTTKANDHKSLQIRRLMLCLGDHLSSLSNTKYSDIGFVKINSAYDLIDIVETWNSEGFEVPEAILIDDVHLAKLNAEGFAAKRKKSKLKNTVLIVFSKIQNDLIRHAAYSIEADDYCYGEIQISEILKKINFLKRLKLIGVERKDVEFNPRGNQRNYYQKRIFDIFFASFALLLSLPFFLIIGILIKLESRGPIFYVSKRAGFGFKIFDFYKFRTMRKNADKELDKLNHLNQYNNTECDSPSFFKVKDDPRVTSFGKILRNTSLDELPQLFNVLKGDMSIVGNKPLPLYEAQQLTNDDCAERFLACSGLTGLWQVLKRGSAEISNEERILLDKIYARKSSLLFDLKIIVMTFPALIQKESV